MTADLVLAIMSRCNKTELKLTFYWPEPCLVLLHVAPKQTGHDDARRSDLECPVDFSSSGTFGKSASHLWDL